MSDIYRGEAVCALNDVIMVTCNYRLGVLGGFACAFEKIFRKSSIKHHWHYVYVCHKRSYKKVSPKLSTIIVYRLYVQWRWRHTWKCRILGSSRSSQVGQDTHRCIWRRSGKHHIIWRKCRLNTNAVKLHFYTEKSVSLQIFCVRMD